MDEFLYMYFTISQEAISLVLIRKDKKSIQKPIYYASKILYNIETKYFLIKKIIYTFVILVQWL